MAPQLLTHLILLLGIGLEAGVNVALAKPHVPWAAIALEKAPAEGLRARNVAVQNRALLSTQPPAGTGQAVDAAFISYAFEFWLFPPFAGTIANPNTFSNNLLNNIGALQGTKPRIRVGGNSGDFGLYNQSQKTPVITRPAPTNYSIGVKSTSYYGDAFFESFQTFPDVQYIYQFDMAWIVANPAGSQVGYQSLNATVPLICKALAPGRLLHWEYGNEPDLYDDYSHNYITNTAWTNTIYANAWKQGVAVIRDRLRQTPECAGLASDANFTFTAPSLWNPAPNDTITLDGSWNAGMSQGGLVKEFSMHRYMTSFREDSITLASTLLNHTHAINSLQTSLAPYQNMGGTVPRLTMGESASISDIGIQNFTDTFAGALWNMDWALHCASQSISRVHFQQGVGFFYNSWEVLNTAVVAQGTKAPYYGNLAAAYAIGNSAAAQVRVYEHYINNSPVDVAYSIYSNGVLKRMAFLNLRTFFGGDTRSSQTFSFTLPSNYRSGTIKRLVGPTSDSLGGVQWDGNMYGLTPNNGLASSPGNVTTGEAFIIPSNGQVSIRLEDSSAAVIQFN